MIKIKSAFPQKTFSPHDIFNECASPVEFQLEKLGISNRYILSDGETALQLACDACSRLFTEENIDKKSIKSLFYITQTPENILPQNSSLLQDQLSLPDNMYAIDINLGCSGYVYTLALAKAVMQAEKLSNALIITADCYSKIMDFSDKNTMSVFGDAATATYITNDVQIGFSDTGTDGSGAPMLCTNELAKVFMNGRAIFNFMMKRIPPSIDGCLKKNGLTVDDIDFFVFHQANAFMLQALTINMKLPPEKVFTYFSHCGNTVSSSIPIALEELLKTNIQGKKVIISGFGVGLSWATNIITI